MRDHCNESDDTPNGPNGAVCLVFESKEHFPMQWLSWSSRSRSVKDVTLANCVAGVWQNVRGT